MSNKRKNPLAIRYYQDGKRALSREQKQAVKQFYNQGKTLVEIAKLLDCEIDLFYNYLPLKYFVKNNE